MGNQRGWAPGAGSMQDHLTHWDTNTGMIYYLPGWMWSLWPVPSPSLPGSGRNNFSIFKQEQTEMIRYFPMNGGLRMISLGKIVPKITRQLIIFYLCGKEGWASLASARLHSPHACPALLVHHCRESCSSPKKGKIDCLEADFHCLFE